MSTSGFIGAKHKGVITGWENIYDSQPSGMGYWLYPIIAKASDATLLDRYQKIKFYDTPSTLSEDDRKYTTGSMEEILDYLSGWGMPRIVVENGRDFLRSPSCNFAYVMDFDIKSLFILMSPSLYRISYDIHEDGGLEPYKIAGATFRIMEQMKFADIRKLSRFAWERHMEDLDQLV